MSGVVDLATVCLGVASGHFCFEGTRHGEYNVFVERSCGVDFTAENAEAAKINFLMQRR